MKLIVLAGAFCVLASAASDYRLEQREPVHHTFANDSKLDIDLVSGYIHVVADGGNSIRIDGEKVMRADTQAQMDAAKRDVTLDANEKNGTAQLYANGPFRNRNSDASDNHGFHERDDRHYDVEFNLTAHVPRAIALKLRSVNGHINAEGTAGIFDVNSVNGAVAMTNVAGSGTVSVVNGEVSVAFRENPKSDTSFRSVNGQIETRFQPGLNANIAVKTLNGAAYTDFDSTLRASAAPPVEMRNGKQVFRTHTFQDLRVGTGGPELKFETLNGDIRIRKQ